VGKLGVAKSISKFLIVVLIIMLVAFAVVNSLPFILKTQRPVEMIQGISMEPTYFDGDLVILGGITTESIQVGDVVGYQSSRGLLIIHRVVAIGTHDGTIVSFMLQGDNRLSNPFQDASVSPDSIVGKVFFHVPAWLGRIVYPIVLALQTPFFLVLAVALVAVILVLWRW
jgi:signal peptidase